MATVMVTMMMMYITLYIDRALSFHRVVHHCRRTTRSATNRARMFPRWLAILRDDISVTMDHGYSTRHGDFTRSVNGRIGRYCSRDYSVEDLRIFRDLTDWNNFEILLDRPSSRETVYGNSRFQVGDFNYDCGGTSTIEPVSKLSGSSSMYDYRGKSQD